MLYNSIYTNFYKWQKCRKSVRKYINGSRSEGWQEGEWVQKGMTELSEVMELFCFMIVVVVTWLYTFVKTHWIVHFKLLNYILFQLYLNKAVFKIYIKKENSLYL